jgi:uncharacterized membrane protein (DUF373 family)
MCPKAEADTGTLVALSLSISITIDKAAPGWKEISIAPKTSLRDWLSVAFTRVEDAIYVGLGVLLAAVAASLLMAEITFFVQYVFAGNLDENIVMLLDRILLIIIFVEVLYTVQVSFRQHVLQPGPFLVVGLIAVTRRILVLTAELPKMVKESGPIFYNAMIELGLLTVLIVALVVSLHFLRPNDPNLAAEEIAKKK